MQKRSLTFKAASITAVTLLCKAAGFLRTAICAAIFGATWQTDSYNIALSAALIGQSVIHSLTAMLIPMRAKVLAGSLQDGEADAARYVGALMGLCLAAAVVLSVLSIAFAPVIVGVFAPTYEGEQLAMTISMTRLFAPLLSIVAAVSVLTGAYNARERYLPGQIISLFLNATLIAFSVLFAKKWGIWAMVAGYCVGSVLQLIPFLLSLKGSIRFGWFEGMWGHLQKTLVSCLPVFVGSFAWLINQTIDKMLGSGLPAGSVSALGYSVQLIGLVQSLVITAVTTAAFTPLSELVQKGDIAGCKAIFLRGITGLCVLIAPVVAVSLLLGGDIVKVVFMRGAFDQNAFHLTLTAFSYYVPMLLPIGITAMCTQFFYALHDTRTGLIASLVGIGANIALDLLLVGPMRVAGLALASTIASALSCAVSLVLLRRRAGQVGFGALMKDGWKIAAGTVALCALILPLQAVMDMSLWRLAVCAAAGLAGYGVVLLAARQRDVARMWDMAIVKLKHR